MFVISQLLLPFFHSFALAKSFFSSDDSQYFLGVTKGFISGKDEGKTEYGEEERASYKLLVFLLSSCLSIFVLCVATTCLFFYFKWLPFKPTIEALYPLLFNWM
jgi:hypothetical protein